MSASRLTPAALSVLDQAAFTEFLAGIYEHSPWIPARAWAARPYASRADVEAALQAALAAATEAEQLGLIRAHPELAGKLAMQGELTDDSAKEQSGAGLDRCSAEEFATLQRLNSEYGARFGFPFIIAVKGLNRHDIIEAMARRVAHTPAEEFATALAQINKIAAFRLADKVGD